MFTSSSRYRDVPVIGAPDSTGRVLEGTDVRVQPQVAATYRHLVAQSDRLDTVAARYYGVPVLWWQICDANPEFLSPLDLLGDAPVRRTSVPLDWDPPTKVPPPWSDLVRRLTALPGVQRVDVTDDVLLVDVPRSVGGREVTVTVEQPVRGILVTHDPVSLSVADLLAAVTATGFRPGWAQDVGQVGQEILIPPVQAS
jgi:hypothetical protein